MGADDLEGCQRYPPGWILWGGGVLPLELHISLTKSHLCQFLMYSKDLCITDLMHYTKIAAILNFHVNMPPYWILCVFGPFFKNIIILLHVHHCTI